MIQNHVNNRYGVTRVYTDGLQSYNNLDALGYDHRVIPHNQGFGEGSETTNHIESFWSQMRSVVEFESGRAPEDFDEIQAYLDTAVWRIAYRNQDLRELWCLILGIYGVNMSTFYKY